MPKLSGTIFRSGGNERIPYATVKATQQDFGIPSSSKLFGRTLTNLYQLKKLIIS
jgi:hypothetical protein